MYDFRYSSSAASSSSVEGSAHELSSGSDGEINLVDVNIVCAERTQFVKTYESPRSFNISMTYYSLRVGLVLENNLT